MVLLMPEAQVGSVTGLSQMGGEGAQWIGLSPFVAQQHFVQNIGDGTFTHSGSLAIRAAVAAGVNITFKLLRNSAVAMTGGQQAMGELPIDRLLDLLAAEGVARSSSPPTTRPGCAASLGGGPTSGTGTICSTCSGSWRRSRASPCWCTTRSARPRSAASAAVARRRRRPAGCSSTSGCARDAATAAPSPTACRSSRRRPSSAARPRSTSPPATSTSPAWRATARPSSASPRRRRRLPARGLVRRRRSTRPPSRLRCLTPMASPCASPASAEPAW